MKCIQCFYGVGANIVDVSRDFIDANTSANQTYIPYNETVHSTFRPRDKVTALGVDSTERVIIEVAVINVAIANDELELLTVKEDIDAKQAEIDACLKTISDTEKKQKEDWISAITDVIP